MLNQTLSRLYSPYSFPVDHKPMGPNPLIVGAATWEIETVVQEAQGIHPDPGTGLPYSLFVPEEVRSQVLQRGH